MISIDCAQKSPRTLVMGHNRSIHGCKLHVMDERTSLWTEKRKRVDDSVLHLHARSDLVIYCAFERLLWHFGNKKFRCHRLKQFYFRIEILGRTVCVQGLLHSWVKLLSNCKSESHHIWIAATVVPSTNLCRYWVKKKLPPRFLDFISSSKSLSASRSCSLSLRWWSPCLQLSAAWRFPNKWPLT